MKWQMTCHKMKLDGLTSHLPLPEKPAKDFDEHISRAQIKI